MKHFRWRMAVRKGFALVACVAAGFGVAFAQSAETVQKTTPNLVQKQVDNTVRTKLPGTVHPLVARSVDQGQVNGSTAMQRMVLLLNRSETQQKALETLLGSMQDKSSPNFHKWLTPDDFGKQFGISDADLGAVTGWLKSQGFTVSGVGRGRQWVEFSGNAAQVKLALGTEMHTLRYKGEQHLANVSAVSVPEALAPAVRGVLSLNDFYKKGHLQNLRSVSRNKDGQWTAVPAKQAATGGALQPDLTFDTGSNGEGVIYALAPGDLSTIYNTAPLLKNGTNGSGVKIAIVGRSDIQITDIETYRQIFGLTSQDPLVITNGVDPGDVANDDVESTLDVEAVSALAPNATIEFVQSSSTNTTDGVDLSALYIVDNLLAPIMSTSYGACEAALGTAGNAFYSELWEQAAAEGITSLVASGDEGGAGCDYQDTFGDVIALGPAVNGLASTPYNVAVGGTEFVEGGASGTFWSGANDGSLSSALGYIPEKVWNESCDETVTYCPPYYVSTIAASGGGQSSCAVQDDAGNCVSGYTKPTWQAGVGVPPDGVRDVPDLSLAAAGGHDGYVLCFEGSCTTEVIDGKTYITSFAEVGGTSAATPAFAGILSLIEQKNGTFLGQINPTLYQLFAASDPSKCNSLTMADPTVASSCLFYDITTGSNATPQEGGEHATTGYDMATGIGSVNAANLLNAWASAAKLATTTTVSVNPTSFTHGQNIAVAVQVAPQSGTGTPSGDVSLQSDQYGAGGYVTLANGAANTSVATLPGGTYNLTANYAGDSVYAASTSAPIPVTVTPEDSVLTLSSFTQTASGNLLNPPVASSVVAYGSYLGLQVQVAGKSQQGTPSGSVSFYDNGQLLGALKLDTAAQATLNTGYAPVAPVSAPLYLSVGTHSITVSYSGDNSFNAAKTSAPYTVTVTKASAINYATSTTQYYVAVGTPITVTAIPYYTWTGAVGTAPVAPTGTMQFTVNNQPIGDPQPISVSSENQGEVPVPEAVLTYAFTTPGQGVFGAIYSGDSNYSAENTANSNGYQVYFQVHSSTLKTPSVTVVANPASPKLGDVVNYTITVHPDKSGDPAPTGTVSIYGAGVEYFTSIYESYPLVNGVATFATTAFQAGNAVTYASYSGDTNYSTGASSAITVPISKAVPAVTLTTPAAYVGINAQTTLHASVIGDAVGAVVQEAALSGAVLFYDAVNGAPAQQLGIAHPLLSGGYTLPTTLPAGTNVITVQYLGDVNWIATTSNPVTIQVSNPDYQLTSGTATVALSAGGSVSVPLTVTPLLGYDLPVTLSCGSGLPAGVSCSFSPAVLTPNGGAVSTTLTLVSDGAYTVASNSWRTGSGVVLSFTALSLLLVAGRSRRKRWARFALAGVVAAGVGALSGCGSDSPKLVSMTLATSSPKVNAGQSVTFTANLSSGDKAATGTVTFLDGSSTLSSQNVSSNAASYSSTALALGTHTITAHYSGDKDHNATSAGPVYQAISGSTSLSVTATDGSNVHTLPLTLNLQ